MSSAAKPTLPQPARDPHAPAADPAVVRVQLQRILAHPLFTGSKRYPTLLAYTVEQTLQGNATDLKERTIGTGAFGRKPDYDANSDPVVRIAAAEVRKCLIQYYYDPAHAGELVIELPQGSYVPLFLEPGSARPTTDAAADAAEPPASSRLRLHYLAYPAVALLAAALGLFLGRQQVTTSATNFDRFWAPFISSSSPVTYCLGEPATFRSGQSPSPTPQETKFDARLVVSDVISLARTIVPLVPRHGVFRVLPASDTTFAHLREGPAVLIGAFDNEWTLRVTEKLRYGFDFFEGHEVVVDRHLPKSQNFTIAGRRTIKGGSADYAIVARLHDKMTGQPIIVVGGIIDKGTLAASELVYNPAYLDALLAKAPKNWESLNLEAVLETQLIDGQPGPPTVLAVEVW